MGQQKHDAGTAPSRARVQVLVVDNAPLNLALLRDMLEAGGHQVLEANSVREAVELLRDVVPDLIVSDIHMPGESGYDFLARVRADVRLRNVPFVLTTASLWSGDTEQSRAVGADGFILRPVEPEVFRAEIERVLGKANERGA